VAKYKEAQENILRVYALRLTRWVSSYLSDSLEWNPSSLPPFPLVTLLYSPFKSRVPVHCLELK